MNKIKKRKVTHSRSILKTKEAKVTIRRSVNGCEIRTHRHSKAGTEVDWTRDDDQTAD